MAACFVGILLLGLNTACQLDVQAARVLTTIQSGPIMFDYREVWCGLQRGGVDFSFFFFYLLRTIFASGGGGGGGGGSCPGI